MSHDTRSVLSAIVEAQAAYEKLPELESNIHELERKLMSSNNTSATLFDTVDKLNTELAQLYETLTRKESELEAATFRELLAEEKLEKVEKLVQSALGIVAPPKPEPVPEPVAMPQSQSETHSNVGPINPPSVWSQPVDQSQTEPQSQSNPQPVDTSTETGRYSGNSSTDGSSSDNANGLAAPLDGYTPNSMYGKAWYECPATMTKERFVQLGGRN